MPCWRTTASEAFPARSKSWLSNDTQSSILSGTREPAAAPVETLSRGLTAGVRCSARGSVNPVNQRQLRAESKRG